MMRNHYDMTVDWSLIPCEVDIVSKITGIIIQCCDKMSVTDIKKPNKISLTFSHLIESNHNEKLLYYVHLYLLNNISPQSKCYHCRDFMC